MMVMQSHSKPYGKIDEYKPSKIRLLWVFGGLLAITIAILVAHDVPTEATAEDRTNGRQILTQAGYDNLDKMERSLTTFEGQVSAILAVQDAVLDMTVAPTDIGIPFDTTREPGDLLIHKVEQCFDRSRSIEKILGSLGLETRHIAVYSTAETGSVLISLLTPQISSHAVTEVKTAKGWMLIDSNARWIGLTEDGLVKSIEDLQSLDHRVVRWSSRNLAKMNEIFSKDFTYVIGLYSRHGRFFPPYSPIPDYNIRHLLTGLFS